MLNFFSKVQNGLLTAFRDSAEICQVMIKSEQLKDAIQELNDVAGAAAVCVKVDSIKGLMVRCYMWHAMLKYYVV